MCKRFVVAGATTGALCLAAWLTFAAVRSAYAPSPPLPPPKVAAIPLDEAERVYLWDIEHAGQQLSQRGFKLFSEALKTNDDAALRALLADEFVATASVAPIEVGLKAAFADVRRATGGSEAKLDRDEFVGRLLAHRATFHGTPQVKFSLLGLAPDQRGKLDGGWSGTGQLRLWGESKPGAPLEVMLNIGYEVARPTEALFRQPAWLRQCSILQTSVAKSPRPLMREVAAERGLDVGALHDNWNARLKVAASGGAYLCDYDRDGHLDMLVADIAGPFLYRGGPGGKMKQVPLGIDSKDVYVPVAFADLDGDGWDDLIYGQRIGHNQPDANGGRRFVDVTDRVKLPVPPGALQAIVGDYDRDGRLDLYFTRAGIPKVGSYVSGRTGDGNTNRLLRNLGNWNFEDVTDKSGAGAIDRSCFTAAWLDADNDGWPDLYAINEFGNGVMLMNRGDGAFKERSIADGPADYGSMGLAAGDIDNDGAIDLYVANMYSKAGSRVIGNLRRDAYDAGLMATMKRFVTGSQLWRNNAGRFEPKGKDWQIAAVGWSYAPALVDLDNDGFLDIYATAGFMSQDRTEPDG